MCLWQENSSLGLYAIILIKSTIHFFLFCRQVVEQTRDVLYEKQLVHVVTDYIFLKLVLNIDTGGLPWSRGSLSIHLALRRGAGSVWVRDLPSAMRVERWASLKELGISLPAVWVVARHAPPSSLGGRLLALFAPYTYAPCGIRLGFKSFRK